jgi:carbon-monoxide dehydrogenase large subunit
MLTQRAVLARGLGRANMPVRVREGVDMPEGFIGQSLPRREDQRFLTGAGRYLADAMAPGMLHAVVLRSPHAHARIVALDAGAARAMPGVLLVLTGVELRAAGLGTLPCHAAPASKAPPIVPPRHILALEAVRHLGEPVAFVVAATPELARDAAEAVLVEYAPLPAVVEPVAALEAGAPQIWAEAPGNLCFAFEKGDRAATEAAFAAAAHVVELSLANQRVTAAPLETRAALARWDAASESWDLECTSQSLHGLRHQLAHAVFHVDEQRVRVHAPDVGGGFGLKNFLFPEYVLALWAAQLLGAPVKWVAEASEEFPGAVHGRALYGSARMALDAAGKVLALAADMVSDLGAYASSNGPGCHAVAMPTAMGSIYAIPAILLEVRGVFTNTTPVDAYRGAGKPEANYMVERLLDAAARKLGLDPLELRRRNVIRAFPYQAALGSLMDCGRYAENIEDLERLADRAGFAARQAASATRGRLRGQGVGCFMETSRGAPNEWSRVRFEGDGSVSLMLGTQSNGQGHETSFPQIAADMLGLPPERFRLVQADTAVISFGNGHGGARSLHQGGFALVRAVEALLAKARVTAARLLQCAPEALVFADGAFSRGEQRVGLDAVHAAEALDAEVLNLCNDIVFPSGAHLAEVEVDRETGEVTLCRYLAVDDYGRLVNPMLTIGQAQGGLAQGIGQALMERIVYDAEGQLLTGSFQDYCLPRAADLPDIDVVLHEVPTARNPLGVKGVGQAGCMAAPQVVVHAVLDALAPLGVEHLDMPLTAETVWRAMNTV